MKASPKVDVKKSAKQVGRYIMVGILSTVVEYISYSIVYYLTTNYYWGNAAGFLFSIFVSFIGNRYFVFENSKETPWLKALLRTYLIFLSTGLIGANVLAHIFIDKWGISPYMSPIIIIILISPPNYFLNKYWVCSQGAYRSKK